MQVAYPIRLDGRGRTATTSEAQHVRELIEQILFTAPGERVNRPDFGSGLLQMVFAPNGSEVANATRFLVQGGLERWLGDRIKIQSLNVEARNELLEVQIAYVLRATQELRTETFEGRRP